MKKKYEEKIKRKINHNQQYVKDVNMKSIQGQFKWIVNKRTKNWQIKFINFQISESCKKKSEKILKG
ncbi:unnamed protein product [Paramecium sonneborni]|uniref:Uncharacterized protein n=1 Tax=Paramecium sonneborni TaxID=65129 RepID=A0A8S1PZ51_9CILI|nr:unnamed protein product [Paramecium sonneborni]